MKANSEAKKVKFNLSFIGPEHYASVLPYDLRAGAKEWAARVIQGWDLVWSINEQEWIGA